MWVTQQPHLSCYGSQADEVGATISIIDDIADQTNLLSLKRCN